MSCRKGKFRFLLWIALGLSADSSCTPGTRSEQPNQSGRAHPSLVMMSMNDGPDARFERDILAPFAEKRGYRLHYLPGFESGDDSGFDQIAAYQQLFREHSPQPDLLEIDMIWPAIFADDLLDLNPYLGHDVESFPSELRNAYTIGGRLLAVPIFIDTGILYYRSDLLTKYGFAKPPETWDELQHMASVIQEGERRAGQKDFWGYVWQGNSSEALTCNALEWFSSQNAGHMVEADRTVHVYNQNALRALERAASWIGTITPPGIINYSESDSLNVWVSGHAAFMRNWNDSYGPITQSSFMRNRFGMTSIPGGASGKVRSLGGGGIAVSRYSEHREAAVATLRYLISSAVQIERAKRQGTVPTLQSLQNRADIMINTPFHGPFAGQVMNGVLARPSAIIGRSYNKASRAYFEAIRSVLMRRSTPENALASLEAQLVQITGFRAVRN